METLSEKYGWTPKQIKEQSASDILDYWNIVNVKKMLREAEAKKNKRT